MKILSYLAGKSSAGECVVWGMRSGEGNAAARAWTVHGLEVSPGLDVDGSWPGGQPRPGRGRFMAWRSAQAWARTVHGLEVSPGLGVHGSSAGGQPGPPRRRVSAW